MTIVEIHQEVAQYATTDPSANFIINRAEEQGLAVLRDTTRLILKYHHIETAAHGIEFYGLFQIHFEIDDLHPK